MVKRFKRKLNTNLTVIKYRDRDDIIKSVNSHVKKGMLYVLTDTADLDNIVVPGKDLISAIGDKTPCVLCIDGTVESYDFTDATVHWTRAHVTDYTCFIVNSPITASSNTYILNRQINNKETGLLPERLNVAGCLSRARAVLATLSAEEKYMFYPKVSCVSVITDPDPDKIFHMVYSFLKLDYPSDHLELVIVDPIGSTVNAIVPPDPRIKIIGAESKTETAVSLPVALNVAVNYAKESIICNFLESSVHFTDRFKDLITLFITSNKPCVMSGEIGIHTPDGSLVRNGSSLSNVVYMKDFWRARPFSDKCEGFYYKREATVSLIPFLFFSMGISDEPHKSTHTNYTNCTNYTNYTNYKYNLLETLPSDYRESVTRSFKLTVSS